jgi:hypothetical protein
MKNTPVAENADLNDRLVNSYVHIREVVDSKVNFQGRIEDVVIDELQFALNLCGVIIRRKRKILARNMSFLEAKFLDDHFGRLKSFDKKVTNSFRVSKTQTLPLESVPRTMRTRLREATCRYSARWADGCIDLYYRPERLIPVLSDCMDIDSPNGQHLLALLDNSFELITQNALRRKEVSLHLPPKRKSSQYLKILLGELKTSVIQHLRRKHPAFSKPNDFLIQYFVAFEDEHTHKGLRYLPLDKEYMKLADPADVESLMTQVHKAGDQLPVQTPREFITNYDWLSSNSFVAYVQDSRCALYLKSWKEEPLVKYPESATPEQARDRRIATVIMQHFRKDTPDQFIVPFSYGETVVGLMLLNCPTTIEAKDRRLLIRSARDVAPQIYLAMSTDSLVNQVEEEKRKAAQGRAYKYVVRAMLHEEMRFCTKVKDHLETQSDTEPTVAHLHFMADEKHQAVVEYRASNSPLSHVNEQDLYPAKSATDESANVSIGILQEFADWIKQIYDPAGHMQFRLKIGPLLQSRGVIRNFEKFILARVLINLFKNSLTAAQKQGIDSPYLDLAVDIISERRAQFVELIARDNCGGFDDEEIAAWHTLTSHSCISYLHRKEEKGNTPSSGMGLLIIAKYIDSTRGEGGVRNVSDSASGRLGAEVTVKLRLQNALHD